MRESPLRVLHLSTNANMGVAGVERLLLDIGRLAEPASTMQHFAFLVGDEGDEVLTAFEAFGLDASSLGLARKRDLARGVVRWQRLVGQFKPDIVHTHVFHGGVFGYYGSLLPRSFGRLKVVHTRHYNDHFAMFGPRSRYELDKWVSRRFDHVIAISDAVARQLTEVEGVNPERVTVVYNGVDADRLGSLSYEAGRCALARAGVPVGPERLVVVCAARFHPEKGQRFLVEAWPEVRCRVPTAELVLLGSGEMCELRRYAAELAVTGVHFLGYRKDAHELMAGSELYVQPSVQEGFGLALVEAMAMGKAAVASCVGGMRHTMRHGCTGLHVPPGDAVALATAMVELLQDEARRNDMGERAAARASDDFSVRQMVKQIRDVYDNVLAPPTRMHATHGRQAS